FLSRIECQSFSENFVVWSRQPFFGHVVQTEYHVLRRNGDRRTIGRVKDVVRCKHQQLCFEDSLWSEWKVNRHLVTVEVSVERRTNEWVQLDSFSFNQLWLERLDSQTVKRRGPVEENWVTF